jgi:hypothetical protein
MFIKQTYAQITNPALPKVYTDPGGGLATLLTNLWRTIILVGGLAFLIYFVIGGIQWITAGDDKSKIESARTRMTQAIIGIAILAASVAIVYVIEAVLQIDILRPVFSGPK